jgi:hypothetical protein
MADGHATEGGFNMLDATGVQKIVAHADKHDIEHLVDRVKSLDATLKSVAASNELDEIIIIIIGGGLPPGPPRGGGYTSVAEYAFTLGLVESIMGLTEQVAGMKQALLEGARRVNSESRVAAAK